jgi:hypothetical protein
MHHALAPTTSSVNNNLVWVRVNIVEFNIDPLSTKDLLPKNLWP